MPFTPLHWGLPLVLGEYLYKNDFRKQRVQFVGLLAATIPDLEGFANLVLGFKSIELHGPLHSLLGCLFIGLGLLVFTMVLHNKYRDELVSEDDFIPRYFHPSIGPGEKLLHLLSPLIYQLGLDIFIYSDIEFFWPVRSENQLASQAGAEMITNIAIFLLLLAIILFIWNMIKNLMRYIDLGQYEEQ